MANGSLRLRERTGVGENLDPRSVGRSAFALCGCFLLRAAITALRDAPLGSLQHGPLGIDVHETSVRVHDKRHAVPNFQQLRTQRHYGWNTHGGRQDCRVRGRSSGSHADCADSTGIQ